jgi:pimeloyl-ACP methyl ester carboxylesterase
MNCDECTSNRLFLVPEHIVTTPEGRKLAVLELGEELGVPVIFHHGTPGSRRAHNQNASVLSGTRAIFYDRPGYGESDPSPGRDVAAAAADTAMIADDLGVDRFAVVGSSGGGPHAIACAALLGERVTRLAVVAGFAPPDDPDLDFLGGMSPLNVDEFRAAFAGEDELARMLGELAEATSGDADLVIDEIVGELPAPDQRALARPDIRSVFREAIAGALVQPGGWVDDDLAFARPWGVDLSAIHQDTLLMQGELDMLVPRAHMDYLARKVPHARLEIVAGGGHTLFDELGDVVRWLTRP